MTLNSNALKIAKEMIERAKELEIVSRRLDNGATILDCGINAKGSQEAGRLFSSICLGGLAKVSLSNRNYGLLKLPTVNVEVEDPRLACIGSQKAGWRVKVGDFFALGSGPARMLLGDSNKPHKEVSRVGVLALETSILPTEAVSRYVSDACGISVENLTILAAKTSSVVGSTQVSSRMVETALFKMDHLGIDVNVVFGVGTAPIAPIIGGDNRMMGVSNDMIIYGSDVQLKIDGDIDIEAIPSNTSADYGMPFLDIFKRSGYDFYKIDQGIFAPAKIAIENISTGEVKVAGKINSKMIKRTLQIF
jgi:methenyltetrahydromethanopterin cyclohydrolase